MERRMELNLLLDFYGPLLTESRAQILGMYCEEDMSLQEIAEALGISRQAVHDAIGRAAAQLEDFESKLGMILRYRSIQTEMNGAIGALKCVRASEDTKAMLDGAMQTLRKIEWIESGRE